MRFTFTLEDWIFILRAWLDESYPLDLGKSRSYNSTDHKTVKSKLQTNVPASVTQVDF